MSALIGSSVSVASGEQVAGDEVVIVRMQSRILIGVVDGLGHGPHAAHAASVFCRYVETRADASLEHILLGAEQPLAHTRGAAASLMRLDVSQETLEFAGVGNVSFKASSRVSMPVFCTAGILGRRVRSIRSFRFPLHAGDLVLLYSDGIGHFDLDAYRGLEPNAMADQIVRDHKKSYDDATCAVARYLGKGATV